MENEVLELIEMLYTMVSEAWGVPLGNEKCIVERDKVLNLLDEIKAQLPVEVAEAKRLVTARDEFIGNAKREAETIRKAAEEKAREMVDEQQVVRAAKLRSNELINAAEARTKELYRVANEYVDDALRRTEEAVGSALDEVRQSRVKFRSAAGVTASQPAKVTVEKIARDELEE
jgi:cell division septum initiation protein DivIVA